jgi:hypothetical protein
MLRGPDLQTKELEFKVVEGQRVKSSFQVKPESVVQVAQGGNLLVVTELRNNVDSVKITDGNGKSTELVNTNGDTFSLSDIAPGVYTLDVIVNQPNSDSRAAYETILVILRPGQAPVQPAEVINRVKVITEVTFEEVEDDDECSNKPGSAGMPYPMDKRTECEKKFYDHCKRIGFDSSPKCENQYELFHDDDCFGFSNSKECDEWFNDGKEKFCEKYPNHKKCANTEPDCGEGYVFEDGKCKPICGEGQYEPGELCRDDGDEDEIRCPDGSIIIPSTGEECPDDNPPLDDPCRLRVPEDKDCDGQIDPEFGGGPVPKLPEEPVEEPIEEEVIEEVGEDESEEVEEPEEEEESSEGSNEGSDSEVN